MNKFRTLDLSRRSVLMGGAVLALGATFAGRSMAAGKSLRVAWYGSVDRAKKFDAIFAAWRKKYPDVAISGEYAAFDPYWERFATQSVGGNLPDVVSMTEREITVYNDSMVDFAPYVADKRLDLSAYSQMSLDAGQVDGKFTMLCNGITIPTLVYNSDYLKAAGIEAPAQWTLDQYRDAAIKLGKAGVGAQWGANDDGDKPLSFDTFLRQKGKILFTEQGLGFDEDNWAEWLTFWDEMRKAGAVPPAGVTAESAAAPFQDTLIAKSQVGMTWINHNQMLTVQKYVKGQMNLAIQPIRDGGAPKALLCGTYWSVPQADVDVDLAVQFVNFFINDPDAIIAYSAELGALPSSTANTILAPHLDAPGKRCADYAASVMQYGAISGPRNPGALQAEYLLPKSNQDVAAGKETPQSAAKTYFAQAQSLMQ